MLSFPHSSLHHPLPTTVFSSINHHPNQPDQTPQPNSPSLQNDQIFRTHNSKTLTLVHNLPKKPFSPLNKTHLLHLSLNPPKHSPTFPGSVATSSPPNSSSLRTLFKECGDSEEEMELVLRALEIRRNLTVEIFKEVMRRKGKFGVTYSSNVASGLAQFIDYVMIEAAAMKGSEEFESWSFSDRVKSVLERLNVVPLIRWLKHNGVPYPKIAKMVCACSGNLDTIRCLADWLKTIHVKGEFIGVVLVKSGDNIFRRSIEELNEIVEYLERNGVRMDWMGYVMSKCPQLLSYSMEEIKTRVWFYRDMGMNEKDFGTMVFDYPRVLGHFSLEEMDQKVNYLKEFGLNNEEVGKLLAFKPQLMGCSIEERWKPLVKYLYYFGISRDGMRRMLTIKPMVFCVDLETIIVPKVRFFQDVGIQDEAIGNMLVKFPPLLTYSLYKKIRRVVIFLMTDAGVSEKNIAKTIASGPELLGCNVVNKLEVNVKYFLSLGIRHHRLGEMIADFPMLLRYSIDLLRTKYRYLRRTMVRPLEDLIEFPRFFSYSLEDRIIPRHKALVDNKINMKLRYMLACSDEEFEKHVAEAVERRRRFESGITNSVSDAEEDNSSEEDKTVDLLSDANIELSDSQIINPIT